MKRFVSYLYSIHNNQKIHNAGFARIELRTGRNRIDIHMRENGYSGKTGTVYLFIRSQENIQGISIGNIIFRNNQADFRYEQEEENIGQTPWQIMQMNGILIMVDERAAFLSQWDEQPVDTARFTIWETDVSEEDNAAQNQGIVQEHNMNQNQSTDPEYDTVLNQDADRDMNAAGKDMEKDHNTNPIQPEDSKEGLESEREAVSEQTEAGTKNNQSESEKQIADGQISDIQTAELQPQPVTKWSQTWQNMLCTYPVLNQFKENENVLCVRIELKDVRLLPEKYWSMVNNSFLLHGFFNYRYLVFGKNGENWFIGIPGIYQNQEHAMASIFGFPDFLPQAKKNEQGEQPGYWYRILEI